VRPTRRWSSPTSRRPRRRRPGAGRRARAQRGRRARRGHQRFGRAREERRHHLSVTPVAPSGETSTTSAQHGTRGRLGGVGIEVGPFPAGAGFERLAAFAADAEAAGLDTLWLRGAQIARALDPLTLAGALSEVTRTLVLGVVATLPDGRNPSVLARDLTTLDVVSGGRAAVCIEGEPGMLAEAAVVLSGSSRVGPRVSPVCTSPSTTPRTGPGRTSREAPRSWWRCPRAASVPWPPTRWQGSVARPSPHGSPTWHQRPSLCCVTSAPRRWPCWVQRHRRSCSGGAHPPQPWPGGPS